MLTAQSLKQYALETLSVDKVGIANIERFKNAPPDMSPTQIMPSARSVVVFIKRIGRGSFRGIDEGTHWLSYTIFNYQNLNTMLHDAGYDLCRFIERHGWEAAMCVSGATTREYGPRGPAPAPDKPCRDVIMHHRIAATLAGLGEIGWSKVFLTGEFGPRQRIGVVLTDAELEPDPIRVGRLCDRCMRCAAECPANAIPRDKSVSLEVEGHKLEWADIDIGKCKLTHFGFNRRTAPYLVKRFPGFYVPIAEQEVTWREAWDLGYALFPSVPTYAALARHNVPALCGARGCIIGCMKHLEQKKCLKNAFNVNPVFSRKKPWALPEKPEKAAHRGFIFNPDEQAGKSLKHADASAWY